MTFGPFGVENDILDRLRDRLDSSTLVASGGAISQQGLSIGELALPLVVVEPIETDVSDATARSDHIVEDQSWLVSIVARHLADPDRLRVDYREVDALIVAAVSALSGWVPPTGVREFRYLGRDDVIHDPGLLEVGLRFGTFYHLSIEQGT